MTLMFDLIVSRWLDMARKFGIFIAFLGVIFIVFGIVGFNLNNMDSFREFTKKDEKEKLTSTDYNLFYTAIQTVISYFDLHISEFDNFKFDDLNNKDKTLFVLNTLSDYRSPEITEEQVITEAGKYFSEFDLYRKSISSDSNQMLFQYQNGKFIYLSSKTPNYIINSEVISNDGYVDSWIVKKKIYFMKTIYSNNKYYNMVYKSIEDLENNQEIYSFVTDVPANQVDNYINIKDELNVYIYTFNRKHNQYFLDTVEMED